MILWLLSRDISQLTKTDGTSCSPGECTQMPIIHAGNGQSRIVVVAVVVAVVASDVAGSCKARHCIVAFAQWTIRGRKLRGDKIAALAIVMCRRSIPTNMQRSPASRIRKLLSTGRK